jgi:hypothetical protein
MKISFDTSTVNVREVAGIIALLATCAPDVLTAALADFGLGEKITLAVGELSVTGTPEALARHDAFTEAAPAPPPPPSPEAAFGAAPAPLAAEVAAAPASSTAETPAPVPAIAPAGGPREVDADGLPWDERIHATVEGGGGGKTGAGKWRAKRKVDPTILANVTAELRAQGYTVPQAPAAPPPPPPPPAPPSESLPPADASSATLPSTAPTATPDAPVGDGVGPTAETSASPSSAPAAPPPPPPPGAPVVATPVQEFARVMRIVTEAQTAGKITAADVNTAVQAVGLAQLRDLMTNPDFIPAFEETVGALIAAAG